MQKAVDAYFAECAARTREIVTRDGSVVNVAHPKPPTIEGLALALGFTSRRALLYYDGYDDGAYAEILDRARLRIADLKVAGMQDGSLNAAGVIFDLKNNYGYADKVETEAKVSATVRVDRLHELTDEELQRIIDGPLHDHDPHNNI